MSRTALDGPADQPPQQTAGATGEVASVSVGVPSGAAPIPITTIPVPGIGDVDITQAPGLAAAAPGQPAAGGPALGRLATKVRKNVRNRKLFPTFTLPRAVALRR
jgi:hypothetical protein